MDSVYLDFSKAFDKVSHPKLIRKLTMVGIHPRIVAWIREFISGRTMMVRLNNTFSSSRSVLSGVPQGGVLSPVLFNIYTYELPSLITSSGVKCIAFADDIKLYQCVNSSSDCETLQHTISMVQKWSED